MNKTLIEQASKLLEEINNLSNIDKLLSHKKHGKNVNFVIKQHFGDTKEYETILINEKHTPRLLTVVRSIIAELERELKML